MTQNTSKIDFHAFLGFQTLTFAMIKRCEVVIWTSCEFCCP